MAKQRDRRMIAVPPAVWTKASQIQSDLMARAGRKFTIAEVVSRGLDCLNDAHARGAWLSPKEAAPVLEQRHRDQVVSVVAQLLARIAPERRLRGIAFDTAHDTLVVHMDDADPFPLVMSGPLMGPDRVTDTAN